MYESRGYQTKQKQLIYAFFAKHPNRHFSAKEVAENLKMSAQIGESTVYRLIHKLTEDGEIRRFHGKNSKSVVYQFAGKDAHCDEHFHLKCSGCGQLIHLDCALVKDFEAHMGSHHGFSIDHTKTVIYGTCESCHEKKEHNHEQNI